MAKRTRLAPSPLDPRLRFLSSYSSGRRSFVNENLSGIDLSGKCINEIDLDGADLSGAKLIETRFRYSHLRCAKFTSAEMVGCDLNHGRADGAQFNNANLSGADLADVNLQWADFSGANLSRADLWGATLRCDFRNAMLEEAHIGNTSFIETDIRGFCDQLDTLRFGGTCQFDVNTVAMSLGHPRLSEFLVRCGLPEVVVIYLISSLEGLSLGDLTAMLQTTFISYGAPDEDFARKLFERLSRNGVKTFFFPENAPLGAKLHSVMRRGVNDHDRILLVCSETSLTRRGVLNEIDETFAREARDGGVSYLLPILLDGWILKSGNPPSNPDIGQAIRDRVCADFRESDQFEKQFLRLVDALRK